MRSSHVLYCPRCNSSDIGPYAAGITGTYFCRNCGYMGTLVIQKDVVKTMKSETGSGKGILGKK